MEMELQGLSKKMMKIADVVLLNFPADFLERIQHELKFHSQHAQRGHASAQL